MIHMDSKEGLEKASCKNVAAWVGCDVSKKTFDVALFQEQKGKTVQLKKLPADGFERSKKGVKKFITWIDNLLQINEGEECRVVMEATGSYSRELYAWMISTRPSLSPAILNPMRASKYIKSLDIRSKTDRLDARALAWYGKERRPAEHKPPSPAISELRELSRHRQRVITQRVAEENRLNEAGYQHGTVRKMLKLHIARLERDEEKLEEEMKKIIENTESLKRDYALLDSISGVGFVTAVTILAELGDLRRFTKARQLSAFAGLDPYVRESGSSIRKKARLSKNGNRYVRRVLYMASLSVVRSKSDLSRAYHEHMKTPGRVKKSGLGVVMRKLLVLMRALLLSGKPYEKFYRQPVEN